MQGSYSYLKLNLLLQRISFKCSVPQLRKIEDECFQTYVMYIFFFYCKGFLGIQDVRGICDILLVLV